MATKEQTPEALCIVDDVDSEVVTGHISNFTDRKASTELRRLQTENETLRAAERVVPAGMVLAPAEATDEMKAAAVRYVNGATVYKNVKVEVLRIEEGIYGEVYEAMLAEAMVQLSTEQQENMTAPVGEYVGNGMYKGETIQKAAENWGLAEIFEAMHARGDIWITTIAAAKLVRAVIATKGGAE